MRCDAMRCDSPPLLDLRFTNECFIRGTLRRRADLVQRSDTQTAMYTQPPTPPPPPPPRQPEQQ